MWICCGCSLIFPKIAGYQKKTVSYSSTYPHSDWVIFLEQPESLFLCLSLPFKINSCQSSTGLLTCLRHWASFTSAHSCHDKSFPLQASHLLICIPLHLLLLSVQTTPAHGSGFKWWCRKDPSERGLLLHNGPRQKGSLHCDPGILQNRDHQVWHVVLWWTQPGLLILPCSPFSGQSLGGECYLSLETTLGMGNISHLESGNAIKRVHGHHGLNQSPGTKFRD